MANRMKVAAMATAILAWGAGTKGLPPVHAQAVGYGQAQRHMPGAARAGGDAAASQDYGTGLTPPLPPPATGGGGAGPPGNAGGGYHHHHGSPGFYPGYNSGFVPGFFGGVYPGWSFWPNYGVSAWSYVPWGPSFGLGYNYGEPFNVLGQTVYGPPTNYNYYSGPVVEPPLPPGDILGGAPAQRDRRELRVPAAQQMELARKYLGYGDKYFGQQRYRDAASRYQSAVRAAPEWAEARFRLGHAAFAMGRFEQAAREFRHGLALDPDWPSQPDRFDRLYGDNPLARQSHFDRLARATADNPQVADYWYVLGVELFASGRALPAEQFFQRARDLGSGKEAVLGYLDQITAIRRQRNELAGRGGADPEPVPSGEVEL